VVALHVLVCEHDLEGVDDLSQGNARILLPVLNILNGVGEDDEVIGVALVVDLGDGSVSARHDGQMFGCGVCSSLER
jgi:hypothetical protein